MKYVVALIAIVLIVTLYYLMIENYDKYYHHDLWATDYQGLPRGPYYNTWFGRQQTHQNMFDAFYEHILRENNTAGATTKRNNLFNPGFSVPNRLPVRDHNTGTTTPYMQYAFSDL